VFEVGRGLWGLLGCCGCYVLDGSRCGVWVFSYDRDNLCRGEIRGMSMKC